MKTWSLSVLPSMTPEWLEFIKTRPEATLFHHPAWSQLIQACYGYPSFTLLLFNSVDSIQAGLPIIQVKHRFSRKRWIALPFTDYCNPLACDGAALQQLTKSLLEMYQSGCASSIEVRYKLPEITGVQYGYTFITHKLLLNADLTSVIAHLNKAHLKNIYRAEENGMRVEVGRDLEHLKAFYRLHLGTRKRQGIPVQPWRFFKLLGDLILTPGYGFLMLAYLDQECVAGALFLHWNQTLTYKFMATTPTGNKYNANHLILWKGICWGCENGFVMLDLGKTPIHDEEFRQFLGRWGAQESTLTYSILSNRVPKTERPAITKVLKNIINISPAWVCKTTGELFYKYTI